MELDISKNQTQQTGVDFWKKPIYITSHLDPLRLILFILTVYHVFSSKLIGKILKAAA